MAYTGSKALAGRGTVVSIGGVTGAGGSFTPIFELDTASFSGTAVGTEDVSNFNSLFDEEFITTMRNNGNLSLGGNDVPTDPGQAALQAAYSSGLAHDFKVQKPAGVGFTTGQIRAFSGLVTKFDTDIKTKNAIKFSSDIKVSGGFTDTAAVPAS